MAAYEQSVNVPKNKSANGTYKDNLEEHLLIHLHELLVPLIDVSGLATVVVIVASTRRVVLGVLAPLDDLLEDGLVNLDKEV